MSYGGQQDGSYGQEDDYGMEDQYGEYDESQGMSQSQGQQKGEKKAHRFPNPDIAAQYYSKATAADSAQGAQHGSMSNNTEEISNQYS
jgi:hypothetical protein